MTGRSTSPPERVHNVLAAYEFGLSRMMFGYGLVYRRHFAAWPVDEVREAPLSAHNRLEWAVDRLSPMLPRKNALILAEQLRATRTGLERASNRKALRSLSEEFLQATQKILDEHWTLKPWQDLGEAIGAGYQELLLVSESAPGSAFTAGADIASALENLPTEASDQSELLASIRRAAAANDLAMNFVELLLVVEQPTFWKKWSKTVQSALVPVPTTNPASNSRYRLEVQSLPSTVANPDIAWAQHQSSVRQHAADPKTSPLYYLWTLDNLERALNFILPSITDAPVLTFDERNIRSVGYNGTIREVSDNFQSWLRLLDELKGASITQMEAERLRRVGTNPLRHECRYYGNDPLLRSLIFTAAAPVGGSRLLPLEPIDEREKLTR